MISQHSPSARKQARCCAIHGLGLRSWRNQVQSLVEHERVKINCAYKQQTSLAWRALNTVASYLQVSWRSESELV